MSNILVRCVPIIAIVWCGTVSSAQHVHHGKPTKAARNFKAPALYIVLPQYATPLFTPLPDTSAPIHNAPDQPIFGNTLPPVAARASSSPMAGVSAARPAIHLLHIAQVVVLNHQGDTITNTITDVLSAPAAPFANYSQLVPLYYTIVHSLGPIGDTLTTTISAPEYILSGDTTPSGTRPYSQALDPQHGWLNLPATRVARQSSSRAAMADLPLPSSPSLATTPLEPTPLAAALRQAQTDNALLRQRVATLEAELSALRQTALITTPSASAASPTTAPTPVAPHLQTISNSSATLPNNTGVSVSAIIYFDKGVTYLSATDKVQLDQLSRQLQQQPQTRVLVQGFSDKSGNAAINLQVSEQRARAVAAYLQNRGIAAHRIEVLAQGDAAATQADDPYARRVEATIR